MKKIVFIMLLLAVTAGLCAIQLRITDFEQLTDKTPQIQRAGEPAVPFIRYPYILKMGEKVTGIEVKFSGTNHTYNAEIPHAQRPQPFSKTEFCSTIANQAIYNSNNLYPGYDYKNLGIQRNKGYDVVYLNIYPYQYDPLNQQISWREIAEIKITTELDLSKKSEQNRKLAVELPEALRDAYGQENVSSYVKEAMSSYRNLPDPNEPYRIILITSEDAIDWFGEYLDWKLEHDLETGVFYVEDIYEEYDGANNQAKIKNFIIDAYETWSSTSTPLEYVVLGGDDEIIPIRDVFINAGGTVDEHMPCDLYYSCLDNSWDDNGNGVYGEVEDEVDLVPELAISRLPVDNQQDMVNWLEKVQHYVDDNTYSNNIVKMLGEYLWGNPDTWGGDSMDLLLEEFDEPYHIDTMYQRDGTYSEYGVTIAINEGLGFINHLGHANEFFVFGQNRVSAASYTNTEYGFAYSQGCYPGAFDEATGQSGECIAENFLIRTGGLYGFIGNSRYGWGIPGQPAMGPSQQYHMPFIQAIFDLDMREFGKALEYSREVMVDGAMEDAFLRWVHYELTHFGDASIALKLPDENFPYLSPEEPVYYDTEGDGDGAINPGETIEIEIGLTAHFDWGNAEEAYAKLVFSDSTLSASIDSVYFGSISAGETAYSDRFMIVVPEDCVYYAYPYRLEIYCPVGDDSEFRKTYSYDFEVSIQQTQWPWYLGERLSVAPIIADINGDDQLDILATTMVGDIHTLDINAQQINETWITGETVERHTAFGNVDSDPENEIIMATRAGNIYAYDLDGSISWQFTHDSDQLITPVLADIDGDELFEVLSIGLDGELLAIDENGELEDGFPIVTGELVFQEIAACDVDNDSKAEIAVATQNGQLHFFNDDGSQVDGFPGELGSSPSSGITILDNHKLALSCGNELKIISPLGEILVTKELDSRIISAPIAADYDNDDELEIAFTTQFGGVYICHQDGTDLPGWFIDMNESISQPPLAVDLDDNGELDIIWFSATNTMYAYNIDGTEIAFSPVPSNFNDNFPASIADIDGDGDFEIVFSTSNRVLILDSKLPSGNDIPWHTYRGNLMRTGYYGDNLLTEETPDQIHMPVNKLIGNYPNPFNPETKISFSIENDAAHAIINIYNIKGQKVYSEKLENLSAGIHHVIWQGYSSTGANVSSGVYFYQLNVNGAICDSKRMLLLK